MYNFIDNSGGFYKNNVAKRYRSTTNVVFRIQADEDEEGKDDIYRKLELQFV